MVFVQSVVYDGIDEGVVTAWNICIPIDTPRISVALQVDQTALCEPVDLVTN